MRYSGYREKHVGSAREFVASTQYGHRTRNQPQVQLRDCFCPSLSWPPFCQEAFLVLPIFVCWDLSSHKAFWFVHVPKLTMDWKYEDSNIKGTNTEFARTLVDYVYCDTEEDLLKKKIIHLLKGKGLKVFHQNIRSLRKLRENINFSTVLIEIRIFYRSVKRIWTTQHQTNSLKSRVTILFAKIGKMVNMAV